MFVPRIESEQARVPFGITLRVVKLVEGAKSESLKNACPFLCDLTDIKFQAFKLLLGQRYIT